MNLAFHFYLLFFFKVSISGAQVAYKSLFIKICEVKYIFFLI